MVISIVLLLGGISLSRLPIDLMPDITYPTLSISSNYENAGPEEIEELLTRPLEEAMSAVPGVVEVTSASSEGVSSVRVTFSWGTNLDTAANDVRDRLDRVIARLPDNATRPTLRKFDLASFPVMILGASGGLDPIQMRQMIEEQVKYRIERVPGVASLDIRGGREREIHVNVSDARLKALNIPLDQVINQIKAQNVDQPAGTIDRGNLEVTVRVLGTYTDLDELRNTVVAIRRGAPVRLSEIANVVDVWRRERVVVHVDGKPGITLAVNKQSGTNTVSVARGVLAELEKLQEDLPQIHLVPIIDTADYIRMAIANVSRSAVYGGVLAVLVLLFFLRNFHSTLIIAVAIPVSIIATFALMYFGGMTLNLMTLGGLALGVGMLLDSSIVTLENIYRLRESGDGLMDAAVKGSEEVTAPIIASTLTTVAVFLPLIFMGGMQGVMFKQFSIVVGFALLCSLLAALTVVPMLAARWLHTGREASRLGKRLFGVFAGIQAEAEKQYSGALDFCLRHPFLTTAATVLILAMSLLLVRRIGVEFMPATDEGEVRLNIEGQVGTRLGIMGRKIVEIEEIVRAEVPEMRTMTSRVGGTPWRASGVHTAQTRIRLKPEAERRRSSEEVAAALRRKLSGIAGVTIRARAGQGLFIMRMGTSGGDKVQVDIRGYDFDTAQELAERTTAIISEVPGVTDVSVSRESGSPEDIITIDRRKAADLKLNVSQVASALQTVIAGTLAGYFKESGNEYGIRVQIKDAFKMDVRGILDLTVTNADGVPVILRNIVDVHPRSGPVLIERKDQERVITVSGDISGRDLGSVYADIRERLRALPVPRGFQIVFAGDYEEQQKSFRELLFGLVLALILVYMVMASLYESLRDPFIVMFSVPLASVGVILMLFLTGTTFNVQSFIGVIMLGGIVVNNAILLVDHANLLMRRDGMPLDEAIREAGRRRLRPILMTAFTTVLALVPLATGMGEGGEAQAPLARAVIGGLMSSTLITLVFVPVVYLLFKRCSGEKTAEQTAGKSGGGQA